MKKRFPALGLNISVQNIFNNRNLPEIQEKKIKQNCARNLVKRETAI